MAAVPFEEYNQTQSNLTEATEALYSVLTTKGIRLYKAPDLREHVLNAVSVNRQKDGFSKQKTSNKIDGAVPCLLRCLRLSKRQATELKRHANEENSGLTKNSTPVVYPAITKWRAVQR